MSHKEGKKLMNELSALLDDERVALLEGNLEAIGELLKRKEVLIDQMNAGAPQSREIMSALQGKVLRNQELLDGALQGIRKVAAHMAAVRRIRRNLETYDKSGRKSEVPGIIDHKIEKRA